MKNTSRWFALAISLATLHSVPAQAYSDQVFCEEEATAAGMTTAENIAAYVSQCLEDIQTALDMEFASTFPAETASIAE